ncbi:hypothetical protein WJX72_003002 [[Myrmecia] bisecta]|uniref:C3H1-type domain-containing protein n=1 Tax=[Myrmecia] bisecta TaxID=41462 RepID=A0AAW1R6C7_9CHLO
MGDFNQLWVAANRGDLAALQQELDKGAPIEGKDPMGRTALMEAVKCGHAECVEELLKRGADSTAKSLMGSTASEYNNSSNTQIARLLEQSLQDREGKDSRESQASQASTTTTTSAFGAAAGYPASNSSTGSRLMSISNPPSPSTPFQQRNPTSWAFAVSLSPPQQQSLLGGPPPQPPPQPTVGQQRPHFVARPVCRYWFSGRCRYGAACRFAHPPTGGPRPVQQPQQPVCRYYGSGTCRFGSVCRFRHDEPGGEQQLPSSQMLSMARQQSTPVLLPSQIGAGLGSGLGQGSPAGGGGGGGGASRLAGTSTAPAHDRLELDDEIEERMRNFGFTDSEATALGQQGVKLWDDHALDVMRAMQGAQQQQAQQY